MQQQKSDPHKPLVESLSYQSPTELAGLFADEEGTVLLHSVKPDDRLARYSFLGVRPYQHLVAKNNWIRNGKFSLQGNVLDEIQKILRKNTLIKHPNLPPFQGGGMGYFSYDLNKTLERVPNPKIDDMVLPDCIFAFYDVVFAWDHSAKKLYLFSSGLPYEGDLRIQHAVQRQQSILNFINHNQSNFKIPEKIECLLPIVSNFDEASYIIAVEKAIEHIYAGDIFEINISQRFETKVNCHPFELYLKLQNQNPAPFSGFLNFSACQIVSSSPERFLKLEDSMIEACPIKGTRRKSQDPVLDTQLQAELVDSDKDRAENIMIVDLMRNDLSRVSLPHTVEVPRLCELQSFATVHHLVSTVTSQLAPQYDAIDLIKATFPGGSITGAPKIRSMEIIAQIEPTARGPYCGSMGYIGFDGNMDLSILIRSYAMKRNRVTFQAGGAITVDSDPKAEYQETLDKAAALKRVLSS